MPRTETHLDEGDIKTALAHWVDDGCPPVEGPTDRVSLRFSQAFGNDPRERDEYAAVVRPPS